MAIKHKRKNSAGYTWQAGDLVEGQLGLNIADGTLHFKKANGNYVKVQDTSLFITDVVQDTTPQLGGDLDVNGKNIVTASNGNIVLAPNGTGIVRSDKSVQIQAQGELRLADSDSSNYVGFKSPATVSANKVWTLPSVDGTNGQVLSTNGSGTLSWATAGGSGWKIASAYGNTDYYTSGSYKNFVWGGELYDPDGLITLNTTTGVITVAAAGTYIFQIMGTFSKSGTNSISIFNITDNVEILFPLVTIVSGQRFGGSQSEIFTITGSNTQFVWRHDGAATSYAGRIRLQVIKIA